jgi:saccharopine dehydrogenase-like NADP-dependent oxidoreductase
MSITTPVSFAARERLREHQAAAAKAVATHTAALARLDAAVARRQKLVAQQDALVVAAQGEFDAAVAKAASVMGIDVVAAVLNLSKSEVRRVSKDHRR